MIRLTLPAISGVLTLSFAIPVSAQAAVRKPTACRMSIETLEKGTSPSPAADALPPRRETSTLLGSAPVGQRQPQASDVTSSAPSSIDQAVAEENARIDELIKGVCKGC